jgi:hypothetical protein
MLVLAIVSGAVCVRRTYQSTSETTKVKATASERWAYAFGIIASIALVVASQLRHGFAFPVVIFLLLAASLVVAWLLARSRRTGLNSGSSA